MLPSAAPRRMHSSALEPENAASQNALHSGERTWLRNSIEIPRASSAQRTRKIAR